MNQLNLTNAERDYLMDAIRNDTDVIRFDIQGQADAGRAPGELEHLDVALKIAWDLLGRLEEL